MCFTIFTPISAKVKHRYWNARFVILTSQAPFQIPIVHYDHNRTTINFQYIRKRRKPDFLTGNNFKLLVYSKFPDSDGSQRFSSQAE